MGYNYGDSKRSYYTERRERKDVVKDHDDRFLDRYFNSKIDCYRWVNIEYSKSLELEGMFKLFPKNCSYTYNIVEIDATTFWHEYYIDNRVSLLKLVGEYNLQHVVNISVRGKEGSRPSMLVD